MVTILDDISEAVFEDVSDPIPGDGTTACAQGWFEACTEHAGPDLDAPCERCGWLRIDHRTDPHPADPVSGDHQPGDPPATGTERPAGLGRTIVIRRPSTVEELRPAC